MIFGKTKMELQVGVFVFIAILIFVFFILLIGDLKTLSSGYKVRFIFNFINGVKIGAPVRFAGVDVGEVKEIDFSGKPGVEPAKIIVVGWVKKNIKIPQDSTVWVNTLGLLGERYVEVMPGEDYKKCIPPGGSLVGTDPIAMHEVAQLAKNIADNLENIISSVRNEQGTIGKLIYDDTLYNELEAFIKDIRRNPWKLFIKTKEKKD